MDQGADLLQALESAVIDGDKGQVVTLVRLGLTRELNPLTLFDVLTRGIDEVGRRFQKGEYFIPDLVIGANAMKAGAALLGDEIARGQERRPRLGKLVIGTVETDLHDIGKNIVALMFEVAGFQVVDLGVNVPVSAFVESVRAEKPDIVGLSTLLTIGMQKQAETVKALSEAGLHDGTVILVGGAPVNQRWADEIGADGYASSAVAAVELAKAHLGHRGNHAEDSN